MSLSATDQNFTDLGGAKRSLEQRFEDFAKRVRSRLLLEETAKWIALVVGLALVTFVLDRTLRLSSLPTRREIAHVAFLATGVIHSSLATLALSVAIEARAGGFGVGAGEERGEFDLGPRCDGPRITFDESARCFANDGRQRRDALS